MGFKGCFKEMQDQEAMGWLSWKGYQLGYRLRSAVDAYSELPLAFIAASANET